MKGKTITDILCGFSKLPFGIRAQDISGPYIEICVFYLLDLRAHKCGTPGPRLNIKTVLSTYGDFHVKDKTAVRTSYL